MPISFTGINIESLTDIEERNTFMGKNERFFFTGLNLEDRPGLDEFRYDEQFRFSGLNIEEISFDYYTTKKTIKSVD